MIRGTSGVERGWSHTNNVHAHAHALANAHADAHAHAHAHAHACAHACACACTCVRVGPPSFDPGGTPCHHEGLSRNELWKVYNRKAILKPPFSTPKILSAAWVPEMVFSCMRKAICTRETSSGRPRVFSGSKMVVQNGPFSVPIFHPF